MEAGNIREKALPKVFNLKVFDFLDIKGISKMERSARLWRDLLQTRDGQVAWQRVVHEAVGKERIECYKVALGLRAGQSYEQETNDLQSRNWRRIMRMHRSNLRLPLYQTKAKVTLLKDHIGAVLAMCTGGPYLFTGGADGKLLMFRVPVFLTFTKERERTLMTPPQPVRGFGQSRTKNGPNFAHDGPVLCLIGEKDFVLSGGVDGTIKLWKMESAPGNACARKYIGHQGAIWCLALGTHTQDGSDIQVMISGSADRTVVIWNIWGPKNARPLMVLKGHFGGVTCLCFVPGMGQVVSGSEDCSIRLWRLTKKEAAHKQGLCEMVLEGHTEAVTALSVFCGKAYPCGTSYDVIYSASRAGDIRMWNREGAVQLKQVY
jgi:WD40 repeat protein